MAVNSPLITHIVFRLAAGGLENGLVNLIGNMPKGRYRHAIICLTESSDFARRLDESQVPVIALGKRPGKDPAMYRRLWRALRELRPDIVHTRNFGTLDCMLPALVAGVRHRVHGEHGRDITDIEGTSRKKRWLRRVHAPLVDRFIAVSGDLENWLADVVRIDRRRIIQIHNGVDTSRFVPAAPIRLPLPIDDFAGGDDYVVGAVGRMDPVKGHLDLIEAFSHLVRRHPESGSRLRLVIVGDGPLREEARRRVSDLGIDEQVWLAGERDDVPELLRSFDVFVQPSLGEGISNTILEAMASGLAVIATDVGGNRELLVDGVTGKLVRASDPDALAMAIHAYQGGPKMREAHGRAGRKRAEEHFSLDAMVNGYLRVYDGLLAEGGR